MIAMSRPDLTVKQEMKILKNSNEGSKDFYAELSFANMQIAKQVDRNWSGDYLESAT